MKEIKDETLTEIINELVFLKNTLGFTPLSYAMRNEKQEKVVKLIYELMNLAELSDETKERIKRIINIR